MTTNFYLVKVVCGRTTDSGLQGGEDEIGYKVTSGQGITYQVLQPFRNALSIDDGEEKTVDILMYSVSNWPWPYIRFDIIDDDGGIDAEDFIGSVVISKDPQGKFVYSPSPAGPFADAKNSYMFNMNGSGSSYWIFIKAEEV